MRRITAFWLHLTVLLALWALYTPAQCKETDAATSQSAPSASDADLKGLVGFGRTLSQCSLFDYALPLFDKSVVLSQNISNQELRVVIASEAMAFYCKTSNNAGMTAQAEYVRSALTWAQSDESLCAARRALAYHAAAKRNWSAFGSEIEQSLLAAEKTGSLVQKGDSLLVKAEGLLIQQSKMSTALDAARSATQLYAKAHDSLGEYEAHMLLGRCYEATGSSNMQEIEKRKALAAASDIAKAPILDPELLMKDGSSLMQEHWRSARQKNYDKAVNQILSLLVIKKFQSRWTNGDTAAGISVRESDLLALLANYASAQGDPLAGQIFLSLSDASAQNALSPLGRASQRWLAGRFWRQAGDPTTALDLLDKADQVLARLDATDPEFLIGLQEDRGLALFQLGRKEEATSALNKALVQAQTLNRADDEARMKDYLKAIASGKTSLDSSLAAPVAAATSELQPRARKFARTGPPVFQSPFTTDYADGKDRAASKPILRMQYERLNPTPTPINISPELLMRSQVYDKAAAKLLIILREKGDSVERLMQLGTCYYELHQWDDAQDAFQRVLKLDPKHGPAQGYLKSVQRMKESRPALAPKM